jgi:hypothetical protein
MHVLMVVALNVMMNDSLSTVMFVPDPVVGPFLVHTFGKLAQMPANNGEEPEEGLSTLLLSVNIAL